MEYYKSSIQVLYLQGEEMKKLVSITRVYSRNFVSDFTQELKNIVGGRLKSYELMIEKGIEKCQEEFYKKYPTAQNAKLQVNEFGNKAISIVIYGEIEC